MEGTDSRLRPPPKRHRDLTSPLSPVSASQGSGRTATVRPFDYTGS
jgi:hypothetical protein